ncbi:hypothetical protein [Mycobacterium camsae]|uniref:hypothetical protein n=1 Tax=Mycobacterium gordonae TaxID=1778 RepID=UPI001980E8BC|nr:hypothetical protein [Mycobacterium gordonae]
MTVTRSQIDAARPDLVLEWIQSRRNTVKDLETHADEYVQLMEKPGGQPWSGRFAEAAVTAAHADRRTIVHSSDAIQTMAIRAFRDLTESVEPKLTNARAMIDNAERLGFTVNDDPLLATVESPATRNG